MGMEYQGAPAGSDTEGDGLTPNDLIVSERKTDMCELLNRKFNELTNSCDVQMVDDIEQEMQANDLMKCDFCTIIMRTKDLHHTNMVDFHDVFAKFPKFAGRIMGSRITVLCPKCLDIMMISALTDNSIEDYGILYERCDGDDIDLDDELTDSEVKVALKELSYNEYVAETMNDVASDIVLEIIDRRDS